MHTIYEKPSFITLPEVSKQNKKNVQKKEGNNWKLYVPCLPNRWRQYGLSSREILRGFQAHGRERSQVRRPAFTGSDKERARTTKQTTLQSNNAAAILVVEVIVASHLELYLYSQETLLHPQKSLKTVRDGAKRHRPSFRTPYPKLRKSRFLITMTANRACSALK